ncbi:uncharacterized protein N7511_009998 [Penicillium nucicola]|uniref:uncharacterized protein n=1 Tax=Penicillium nucicola TaxID=1850975 RepID=UPI00254554D6|nr:uncharacterized protein N7511_009998 [Penicillium nucicola]KAJ5748302.1 hypothetical protein N7511_009998 [Penicillium nucicola]
MPLEKKFPQEKNLAGIRLFSNFRKLIDSVNLTNVVIAIGIPLLGCGLALNVPLNGMTLVWSCLYWFLSAMGITAGYHRLWAHKSYSARLPLQILLALLGAAAVEGSIRRWSRDHRAHHRYVDSDSDPYSVHKGLLHAHMGWFIFRQDRKGFGKVKTEDLDSDQIVVWQNKNYVSLFLVMTFIVPTIVAGFGWGDYWGGFVYAGCLRMFVVQQNTYCINSLAHWLGDQPYQSKHSPRNNLFAAIMTLGEGYHNFHHEFPNDYRNGIRWFDFDPTKWFLEVLAISGLVYDLHKFPENEIAKGRLQERVKSLNNEARKISWGIPEDQLPIMTWKEFQNVNTAEVKLTCINNVIYDISGFISQHPGGNSILGGLGKDATEMFHGGIYEHSNAAHNLLSQMRKAKLATQRQTSPRMFCPLDFSREEEHLCLQKGRGGG